MSSEEEIDHKRGHGHRLGGRYTSSLGEEEDERYNYGIGMHDSEEEEVDDDENMEEFQTTYFRRKRKEYLTKNERKDEDIYGIFHGGISDEDEERDGYVSLRAGAARGKKRRGKFGDNSSKKLQDGIQFIGSKQQNINEEINMKVKDENELKLPEIDPTEQQFRQLIGSNSSGVGNNNSDFRNLVNNAATIAKETEETAAAKAKSAPVPLQTGKLGQWEKHTKGFGKKMLEKMGFKGRLGARETGISAAVEVKVRPDAMGLGFGDFVESSMLENNKKLEAELLGKEYVAPEKEKEKTSKQTKNFAEKRAESKSWKLGGTVLTEEELLGVQDKKPEREKSKKSKRKSVSFDEMIGLGEGQEPEKQVIVDMRGPTTRFVLDPALLGLSDSSEKATAAPLLGQELLYNLNLLVDMEQLEVDRLQRKLSSIDTRVTSLESDLEKLSQQFTRSEESFEAFDAISKAFNKIESTIQESQSRKGISNGPSTTLVSTTPVITLEMIVNAFVKLFTRYPKEVLMIGLIDIIPLLSEPIISKALEGWDIRHDPMRLIDLYIQWTSCLSVFEISTEDEEQTASAIDWKLIRNHPGFREMEPKAIVQTAYSELNQLIEKLSLPRLRRFLLNDWNVKLVSDVQSITGLMSGLQAIYQPESFRELINVTILPKLTAAVDSWSPTTERTSLDSWILPWKKIIGKPLSTLFPEIRRKLAKALTSWDPQDQSAYYVIKPWQDVFDSNSMENFLLRHIVPKLVSGMRQQSVEPQGQSTKYFTGVLLWRNLLSKQHILALLEGEFFPKWFQVLAYWLGTDDPDYSEISMWYTNWKSLIPEELHHEKLLTYYFNYALDMMSQALSSPTPVQFSLPPSLQAPDVNYFTLMEKYKFEERTMQRLEELKQGTTLSDLSSSSRYYPSSSSSSGINSHTKPLSSSSSSSRPPPVRRHIDISFRDLVEEFATRNNVEFTQKLNSKTGETMQTIDGKILWEFNGVVCYIDNHVVYVKKRRGESQGAGAGVGTGEWYPISLDDLLELSKV